MTINDFLEYCENFTSSKEYFDLYKEATELDVSELWLEHQCYLDLQDKTDENFNESYYVEAASAETEENIAKNTEEKKDGFFKNIWKKIKSIFNSILGFFKGIWQKITGKTEDIKDSIDTMIKNKDEAALKKVATIVITKHKKLLGNAVYSTKNLFKKGVRLIRGKSKELSSLQLSEEEKVAILSLYTGSFDINPPIAEEYKNALSIGTLYECLRPLFEGNLGSDKKIDKIIQGFEKAHTKVKNEGIFDEYDNIHSTIQMLEKHNSDLEKMAKGVGSDTKNNNNLLKCYTMALKAVKDTITVYRKVAQELVASHNAVSKNSKSKKEKE